MIDESIKAGDIVQLKSGGPLMTVEWTIEVARVGGNAWKAHCAWFTGHTLVHGEFFFDGLSIIPKKNPESIAKNKNNLRL